MTQPNPNAPPREDAERPQAADLEKRALIFFIERARENLPKGQQFFVEDFVEFATREVSRFQGENK